MKQILFFLLVLFCSVSYALAGETPNDISKEANALIRQAERNFFSSKAQEASDLLNQAAQLLEQLRTIDEGNSKLKSLQGKHDRLRKRVDQKLDKSGNTVGTGETIKKAVTSPGDKPLSHGAKSNLKKAHREMDFAEKELTKAEKSLAAGDFNMLKSYSFNTNGKIEGAKSLLDTVIKNNRANPDNPEVVQAFSRLDDLQAKYVQFSQRSEGQQQQAKMTKEAADADAEALNSEWLPRIKVFIDYDGTKRLQFPGMHNPTALVTQDEYLGQAKDLLDDCQDKLAGFTPPHELANAIKDLKFKIEVYEQERNAGSRNRVNPVRKTLSDWSERLKQNEGWNPDSGRYLFVVSPEKISHQKKQIEELSAVMADEAKVLSEQLAKIEKDNDSWQKKKTDWANRPQPFPAAGVQNQQLDKELTGLLRNRGVKFDKLHIVDKDWWVLKGEYRYMKAAYLSKDGKGAYWSSFNFRQVLTLSGYGPTELWEMDDKRIRLP